MTAAAERRSWPRSAIWSSSKARSPAPTDILVQVTGLDAIYEIAKGWLAANAAQSSASEILETGWKSRLFTVEPVAGHSFAFWEWMEPLKDKPIAIEGDLSAAGMSFAIVVARWNAVITDRLLEGSLDALYRSGAAKADIEIVRVPGAWEVPPRPARCRVEEVRRRHHAWAV